MTTFVQSAAIELKSFAMRFTLHIGIDYSGAQTPESRLKGLQVYEAKAGHPPRKISTPTEGAKNWTRLEVAHFCAAAIETGEPVIIGIDHAFSFPMSYMERFGIETWEQFLDGLHAPLADGRSAHLRRFRARWQSTNRRGNRTAFVRAVDIQSKKACFISTYRVRSRLRLTPDCRGCFGCGVCSRRSHASTSGRSMASTFRKESR